MKEIKLDESKLLNEYEALNTTTEINSNFNSKEVYKFFEDMNPVLKKELKKRLMEESCKESDCEKMRKQIEKYIEENTDLLKPEKHIAIEVTATPEELEERKMRVNFIALDEYGIEAIKKMKGECE